MNHDNIQALFRNYIAHFDVLNNPEHNENYKWNAIAQVQKEWNPEETDFAAMFKRAFALSYNLINNHIVQPASGIVALAKESPEEVRAAFYDLLKEDHGDIDARQGRILSFVDTCNALVKKHFPNSWKYEQDVRAAIAYLAMIKPAENYLFRSTAAHHFAKYMGYGNDIGAGQTFKLRNYYEMCDQLAAMINGCQELLEIDTQRAPVWKDPSHHVLVYDLIYCMKVYGLEAGMTEPVIKTKSTTAQQRAYREQIAAEIRSEIDGFQKQIDQLAAQVQELPVCSFEGLTMKTKGFGTVTIARQDGKYVYFDAGERTRQFALPDCVANGYLIPEDASVIERCRQEQRLMRQINELENKQKMKYSELRRYGE